MMSAGDDSDLHNLNKAIKQWKRTGKPPDGYVVVPPDGQWAWVVLIACCGCGFVGVTVSNMFGVLLNDLILLLETNVSTLSWSIAISSGCSNILGPVATIIIHTFSCRSAIIVGGMIICIGLILTSYATDVWVFVLAYGAFTGVGLSLTFIPITVVASLYFKKYLTIAMGWVTAGYALSKLVMVPACQLLLETYGCRGTLFIMSAFMLHICVGGALCQPAHWHYKLIPDESCQKSATPPDTGIDSMSKTVTVSLLDSDRISPSLNSAKDHFNSSKHSDSVDLTEMEPFTKNGLSKCETNKKRFSSTRNNKLKTTLDFNILTEKLFYLVAIQASLLIATMVYSSIYIFPFGVEAGLLPMEAAGLVSTRSLGEIVGRLAGPVIITFLKLPLRVTYMATVFLHGISILALTFMLSAIGLYCVAGVAGLIFGAVVGLSGPLIVDTMGVERLPSVLGLNAVIQGVVLFAVGPLVGWLRDLTGSYKSCLILIGIFQFLITLIWLMKPFLQSKKPSNETTSQ